ncbi:MAG: plasmid pRiA4b ORF-3 family protein [Acidobacteriota bacterium]
MPPAPPLFELRAELLDVEPPVWRRLRISSDRTLADLHVALQALFGWENRHLHQFTSFDGRPYIDRAHDPYAPPEMGEERDVRLTEVLLEPGTRLGYEYDFGDEWEIAVWLERTLDGGEGGAHSGFPELVDGNGAAPPEDCGGPCDYEEIVAILADATHPDHEEIVHWLPSGFDPAICDRERIRDRLKASTRPPSA